ncbi:MAG TPA: ABC transporter substrate-binding protein [Candidatus Borkfalkia excrementavium]|uniref:ABC transporter substrate-binding protein n=1 Tax=Candidatus Borkfalkia excrementavium TaxID=2838505 RepID=A0A9D1ZAZ0_9FIRM|nr:ABC transporter substrate-binding protein [Candidatus Borkfalkia excrementavium]
MKKILTAILCCIFALIPLTACAKEDSDGLKKIRVSEVTHSIFYAPMYIADALGYFEDEGIKIELTNAGGADAVMASVLSNGADIGFCGPEAALYVLVGGSNNVPTVFGQLTKRDGSFLVSRVDEADTFTWESLEGKEILAGRKGGVPAMTFEYVLNEHGLRDGQNVTMNYDVNFNYMTAAFESGTADYCTMFEPVASEYEKAGKGYVVASVGEASGEVPYTCYIARENYIEKNESYIEGFLRAVMKGIKYVNETDSKTAAPYLAPYFDGTDEASIAVSLDSYKSIDAWQTDMTMTEAAFNRLQDIIANAGELERRVSLSEMVNTTYSQKVYAEVYA